MTPQEQYRNHCKRHSVCLFAQPWWLDAMDPDWQVALDRKGTTLAGAWPYFPQKKWGTTFWRNPPLTPYLGPQVFYSANMNGASRARFFRHTAGRLLQLLQPLPAVCQVALEPHFKEAGMLARAGFEVAARQTFLLSLQSGPEALLLNTHSSVRHALKEAASVLTIEAAPAGAAQLWAGQQETLQRKGAGAPAHNFATLERAIAASVKAGQGMLWAAREGTQTAALLWAVWDQEQTYYLASTQVAGGHGAAVTALIWHAIGEACRRGNTVFDFEGSMDGGIEHFFRGFGGQLENYLLAQRNASLLFKVRAMLRKK